MRQKPQTAIPHIADVQRLKDAPAAACGVHFADLRESGV
jgi:hypothetical protein